MGAEYMILIMKLNVLYEDNHIIAVLKPAGLLTDNDGHNDSLFEEVKKYLKEKYNKPGNVFLGLVHRLDRNVSGIVLFAKTSKGASRLSEQFRNKTIRKVYEALVEKPPLKAECDLVDYLLKDKNNNTVSVVDESHGQRAELHYKVLKKVGDFRLLRIEFKTGRSHQIRVQLSNIGCPIVGDVKYGSKVKLPDQMISLSAVEISFKLAAKNEIKTLHVENGFEDAALML
jgi:23S rRNA pseudouridine1911/1915/1917 synthase